MRYFFIIFLLLISFSAMGTSDGQTAKFVPSLYLNWDDQMMYDEIKNFEANLAIQERELKDSFNEISALLAAGDPIDIELQQLTYERNSFNKDLCPPGRTRFLGFYVYNRNQQAQALEKLRLHYDIVVEHLNDLREQMKLFEETADTPGSWHQLQEMYLWIQQFAKKQCNAVGFGYIAGRGDFE